MSCVNHLALLQALGSVLMELMGYEMVVPF